MESTFEIVPKTGRIGKLIEKFHDDFKEGYIFVGKSKTFFPRICANHLDEIKNFEVRNSDVFVATFPKSGTTWMQEMAWMIINNLNFKEAQETILKRSPYLEISGLINEEKQNIDFPKWISKSTDFLKEQNDQRIIKTHLPFSLLPQEIQNENKSPKIIYVMRNPKDVCLSYYHHFKHFELSTTSLDEFCEAFLADTVLYAPYWHNIFSYWNQRHLSNILIVKYEDMKKDLPGIIRKVANFLGKTLTEEEVVLLTNHLSFETMKKNKAVDLSELRKPGENTSTFIRAGVVGKYKEEMSQESIKKLDEWIKANVQNTSFEKEYDFSL